MNLTLIKNPLTQGVFLGDDFINDSLPTATNVPPAGGGETKPAVESSGQKKKKTPGSTASADADPRPQARQPSAQPVSEPEREQSPRPPKEKPPVTLPNDNPVPEAAQNRQLSLGELLGGGRAGQDTFQRPGGGKGSQAFKGRAIGANLLKGGVTAGQGRGSAPSSFGRLPLSGGAGTSADVALGGGGNSETADNPFLQAILRQG